MVLCVFCNGFTSVDIFQVFGDPCSGAGKILAVTVACSAITNPTVASYGFVHEHDSLTLSCGAETISDVTFASYGLPIINGQGSYTLNPACNAPSSVNVVKGICNGRSSCTVGANNMVKIF